MHYRVAVLPKASLDLLHFLPRRAPIRETYENVLPAVAIRDNDDLLARWNMEAPVVPIPHVMRRRPVRAPIDLKVEWHAKHGQAVVFATSPALTLTLAEFSPSDALHTDPFTEI